MVLHMNTPIDVENLELTTVCISYSVMESRTREAPVKVLQTFVVLVGRIGKRGCDSVYCSELFVCPP